MIANDGDFPFTEAFARFEGAPFSIAGAKIAAFSFDRNNTAKKNYAAPHSNLCPPEKVPAAVQNFASTPNTSTREGK